MTYLSAWAIVVALAIIALLMFGRRAGYGLIIAVILFAMLAGAERFKELFAGQPISGVK